MAFAIQYSARIRIIFFLSHNQGFLLLNLPDTVIFKNL
jgi:hypothetical protein